MWIWAINALMSIMAVLQPTQYAQLVSEGATTGAWVCTAGPGQCSSALPPAPKSRQPIAPRHR